MTKQERDAIRAEASMRVLSALNAGVMIVQGIPTGMSDEHKIAAEGRLYRASLMRAQHAIREANALVAELQLHEEAPTPEVDESLFPGGIPENSRFLSCKHGVPSFEPCQKCDDEAAAVAAETGKEGNGGNNEKVD